MDCPHCSNEAWREEVDVEVGIIYGPWGCPCGWSEWSEYSQLDGPTATDGKQTDQWGYLYPTLPAVPSAREVLIPVDDDGNSLWSEDELRRRLGHEI